MKKLLSFGAILSLILCVSCSSNDDGFIGETVKFPRENNWKILGKDTVCDDLLTKDFKILVYLEDMYCNSCVLHFKHWQDMIAKADTSRVSFLFYLNSMRNNETVYTLSKIHKFNYPIIIDRENRLYEQNKFIEKSEHRIMLLNKDNTLILDAATFEQALDSIPVV